MEAGTCQIAPSYEEVRADAVEYPGGHVDQCPSKQDIVDLMQMGRIQIFPPSGKELCRYGPTRE